MKAKELMIGDWVDRFNTLPYYKVIAVDNTTTEVTISQTGNNDDTKRICWDDKLEPIPLTPEILEKNGFEYKEGETGMYGVEITPCYLRDDVPFEVFCDGEPFAIWFKEPINIKYVHQLQNALRLCGIEKEITL